MTACDRALGCVRTRQREVIGKTIAEIDSGGTQNRGKGTAGLTVDDSDAAAVARGAHRSNDLPAVIDRIVALHAVKVVPILLHRAADNVELAVQDACTAPVAFLTH